MSYLDTIATLRWELSRAKARAVRNAEKVMWLESELRTRLGWDDQDFRELYEEPEPWTKRDHAEEAGDRKRDERIDEALIAEAEKEERS